MQEAAPRDDETGSLAALRSLDVLDSAPEAGFDALVRAASLTCGKPVALLSLIDTKRQWFKANLGLPGVTETARELAFCAHAVLGDGLFEVADAALDPRFADNPLVTGDPSIRFYAGAPLRLSDGHRVGTLCVIDRQPGRLSDTQREVLLSLATAAAHALEGRRASRLLRKSEEFLDRTGRLAGVGGWELDVATGEVTWSDETRRIHGVAPDYRPVLAEAINFYAPEARPVIQAAVERGMARGEGWDLELALVRADGRRIWARALGSVDFRDGKPVRLVGAFQDITERKELQLQLAAALAELRDLYEHAPTGLHSLDAQGRFVHVNATELAWLGCTRDELIGKRGIAEFFTPEGRREFGPRFHQLIDEGRIAGLEFDLVPQRGAPRRVSISATAVHAADGRFLMTRTVMHDITELHRARELLGRLNREQSAMLDNDLVGIAKLRGRVGVWTNRGLERIFGYAPGELREQPSRLLYVDDASYHALGEAAYPVLRAGGEYRTQLQMLRKDGSRVWIDMSGSSLSDTLGESMWLLADITPLKQAEANRLKALELQAENRQLQEAGRLKGLFLSNMSHELRTPLNAVLGFAQLLQAGVVRQGDPKFDTYLGQIAASGRHLLQLIDTMLDFGQTEAGRLVFRPETVQLPALLAELGEAWSEPLQARRIDWCQEVDAAASHLIADPWRLKQVLSAFVSNAIKFAPEGSRVSVRARREGSDGVRIEVEDGGIGIAEDDLPKLFQAFQQLSTGDAKTHPGTGMGLALARRLVEAQGGTVGVRSVAGAGSVFHLVLPAPASPR